MCVKKRNEKRGKADTTETKEEKKWTIANWKKNKSKWEKESNSLHKKEDKDCNEKRTDFI